MKPAPTAASINRSPFFSFFSSNAVAMARGIVPAVVLPKRSIFTITFSRGIFSRSAVAQMMRRFAWCEMKQSTSALLVVTFKQARGHLRHFLHRILKDLLPILMNIMHFLVDGFMGRRVQAAAAGHVKIISAVAFNLMNVVDESKVFAILGRLPARPHRRHRRR